MFQQSEQSGQASFVLLNFFSRVQHFHTGHERAVNDSKPAFLDIYMVANWSL
jgi:hypothetical protein